MFEDTVTSANAGQWMEASGFGVLDSKRRLTDMIADSGSRTLSAFDFDAFARNIYDAPSPVTPFLWPALYGGEGESGQEYQALFVFLQAFNKQKEWRRHWETQQCGSAHEAIQTHRRIFFDWAYSSPSADLFNLFGKRNSIKKFYQRFYITDLWKDHNPERHEYWLSKLEIELQRVPTQCVIFVGTEPARRGPGRLKDRVPAYKVLFPADRPPDKRERFKASLEELRKQLSRDGRIPLR